MIGSLVQGRRVAVVGRSASLVGRGLGGEIDLLDVVVRVNWTLPLSRGMHPDFGSRTDLLYHCATCATPRDRARLVGVPTQSVDKGIRRDLAEHSSLSADGFRPRSGVVAVADALESGASEVRVYGIDFYRSPYAPGQRIEDHPKKTWSWGHDHAGDLECMVALAERYEALVPDQVLGEILAGAS